MQEPSQGIHRDLVSHLAHAAEALFTLSLTIP